VGLIDDTCAGVEWVRNHPAVDPERIVLSASAPAHIRPSCMPRPTSAFERWSAMADAFADMLNGVTRPELMNQWDGLPPPTDAVRALASFTRRADPASGGRSWLQQLSPVAGAHRNRLAGQQTGELMTRAFFGVGS
jgi:hypothetical protein